MLELVLTGRAWLNTNIIQKSYWMFICPGRRNVNVWRVLAALIWGTGGFWSCAISVRRGFAWFYNINMARAPSLRNAQGEW